MVLDAVKFEAEQTDGEPPSSWGSSREWDGTAWECTISYEGREMVANYYMGSAHYDEPTAADVLQCLTSDVSFADDPDEFDGIVQGMPYREARRVWEALEKNAADMRRVFGADLDQLTEEVRDQ